MARGGAQNAGAHRLRLCRMSDDRQVNKRRGDQHGYTLLELSQAGSTKKEAFYVAHMSGRLGYRFFEACSVGPVGGSRNDHFSSNVLCAVAEGPFDFVLYWVVLVCILGGDPPFKVPFFGHPDL